MCDCLMLSLSDALSCCIYMKDSLFYWAGVEGQQFLMRGSYAISLVLFMSSPPVLAKNVGV